MIIYNCRVFTANRKNEVIDNGYVEIKGGKITAVGKFTKSVKAKVKDGDIDALGYDIYPGFIDAHTHIGVWENALGCEGADGNEETDPCTPHLRAIDMINPLDYCFTEAVQAGVTTISSGVGSANPIGGTFLAMKTAGSHRIDKLIVKNPVAVKFALGENPKMTHESKNQSPVTRMATAAVIREQLYKAKRYMDDTILYNNDPDENSPPDYDIRCEALIPLLKREIKAHFHCHRADDIFTAIRIAEEFSLDYVLIHATDGALIAEELQEACTKAVIGPIICDRSKPELANLSISTAAVLADKIPTAICTDHPVTPIQYLGITAGIAVKGGLSKENALLAVTRNAAEIIGISDRVGSLEKGKDADIVCFNGNPFEISGTVHFVMIDGLFI